MGNIEHNKSHAIDSSADHTSTIVEDNIISADANGLPKDAGVASTNVKKHNLAALVVPVETDDSNSGYSVGSMWWFPDGRKLFVCFDASVGSAIWKLVNSDGLVSNKSGDLIPQLYAVYPGIPQGAFPTIELAQADTEITSRNTSGVILADIADNGKGYVLDNCSLYNVDGSGTTFGESWANGDTLWLSAATAGYLTKTIPEAPNHATKIGQVISNHATQGIISVNVQNGWETYELHDVSGTPGTTNDFLLNDGSIYNPTNFDTEVSANSDVTSNTAHTAGDGTDHSGVATTELDNLGTTAINADLLPSGDNTRDLGTSANKFKNIYAVDVIFEDLNNADFKASDLATHQLDAFNEMATTEFNTTAATAGGVRTITITQPDSEKHEFIIGEKRLEQPTQTTMTKVHTGLNGTDASPNTVYTYVQNDGADDPELTASNTNPNGILQHVDGVYELIGSISGSTSNVYATNNVKAYIHEKLENILDRFKEQGSLYKSGMDITADADTFTITSGTAKHVVSEAAIPSLEIDRVTPADTQFTIEDDSTYTTYTDFQIDEYYDGVAVANTHHVKCRIGVVINNPELTSARFHIIPQRGATTYTTSAQAWIDASGMAQTTPRADIVKYAFIPVADIVIKNTTGTFTLVSHPDTGLYYDDVRGVSGEGGGGGGAASQNLYESFTGDSGSSTASTSTDTMAVVGGTGITTTVTNDQISIAGDAASLTAAGIQENATTAEIDTATSDTLTVTPNQLNHSDFGLKYVQITVADYTTDVATGDGKGYLHIPAGLDGYNLVEVHAEVITAGTTGTMDIQIYNVTGAVDMLSTKITIDSGETGSDTAATPPVINISNDDVSENDLLRIDNDAIHTTPAKGEIITLGFRKP